MIIVLILIIFFASRAWATPKALEGFEFQSNSNLNGSASINTGTFRTGLASLRVNPSTSSTGYYTLWIPTAEGSIVDSLLNTNDAYLSFYFRIATAPASNNEEIYEAVNDLADLKAAVRLRSDRKLAFYDSANSLVATGATVLSLNTWYLIEILTGTGASANYEIKINGVSEISGTANQTTQPHGTINLGKVNNQNSQTVDFYYDDIVLDDSAYTGPHDVRLKVPTGNGSPQDWNQGTGASDYEEVDEIPTDDETTYIENKNAGGSLFTLTSNASAGISGTIIAVKPWCRVKNAAEGGESGFYLSLKSAVGTYDTSVVDAAVAYTDYASVTDVDPDTSSTWALVALDAVSIGPYETFGWVCNATTCGMEVAQVEAATPTPTATATNTPTPTVTSTPTVTPTPVPVTGGRLKQRLRRVYNYASPESINTFEEHNISF